MKYQKKFASYCTIDYWQKRGIFLLFWAVFGSFLFPADMFSQSSGKNFAVLIGGLGGEQKYSDKIFSYLQNTRRMLVKKYQFNPSNVYLLAETKFRERENVDGVSNEQTIRELFARLAKAASKEDRIFVFLFGHGSFDGHSAALNIPRRDLKDTDYGDLIDQLPAKRIVFINTASVSFPFIAALSGENRIVITATSSATQRNFTLFPQYLVEGLQSEEIDFDRNGVISVLELFRFASEKTERYFSGNNHLATEHALLEDTGDKHAFRFDQLAENNEGYLAAITYLQATGGSSLTVSESDTLLTALLKQKEKIEQEIARLKDQKNSMKESDYFARLEELLVRLADVNERIEKK